MGEKLPRSGLVQLYIRRWESSSTGKQSDFLERSRRARHIDHFSGWESSSTLCSLAFLTGSRRAKTAIILDRQWSSSVALAAFHDSHP